MRRALGGGTRIPEHARRTFTLCERATNKKKKRSEVGKKTVHTFSITRRKRNVATAVISAAADDNVNYVRARRRRKSNQRRSVRLLEARYHRNESSVGSVGLLSALLPRLPFIARLIP